MGFGATIPGTAPRSACQRGVVRGQGFHRDADIAKVYGCASTSLHGKGSVGLDTKPSQTGRDACWLATVSRPDIRASLAQIASKANLQQESDTYRVTDFIKMAKKGQPATVLKHLSGPRLGAFTWAGRSDAAYGDHAKGGRFLPRLRGPLSNSSVVFEVHAQDGLGQPRRGSVRF